MTRLHLSRSAHQPVVQPSAANVQPAPPTARLLQDYVALKQGIVQALFRAEDRRKRDTHAKTGPDSEAPVQRKTGFEVELDVPAYIEPPDEFKPVLTGEPLLQAEELAVQSFLTGGLIYGHKYGLDADGMYHLTADHNAFSKKHSALYMSLKDAGKLTAGFYPPMTNLEYVTAPFEEFSADTIDEVGTSITNHATATAATAKSGAQGAIGAPARNLMTGVPKAALKKLVGDVPDLHNKIDALDSAISGNAYFQQSSGLLPSEIEAYFEMARKDILDRGHLETALTKTGTTKAAFDLLDEHGQKAVLDQSSVPEFVDQNPQDYAKAALLGASARTLDALTFPGDRADGVAQARGFLLLCAQYYIGSLLDGYRDYTGGTSKNRVSMLSRVKLHEAREALSAEGKQVLAEVWGTDKATFFAKGGEYANGIAARGKLTKGKASGEVLGSDAKDSIDKIMAGTEAPVVLPGRQLPVEDVDDNSIVNPGQKLIAMEDRDVGKKLLKPEKSADNIGQVFAKRWRQMYGLRQQSLTPETRQMLVDYKALGIEKLSNLMDAAKYQLPESDVEALQEKLNLLHPIILDPSTLTEIKVGLLTAQFANIDTLRLDLVGKEVPAQKRLVVDYLYNDVKTDVRARMRTKIDTADSQQARSERHASITYTLSSGVKGKISGRADFHPDITVDSGDFYIHLKGDLAELFDVGNFCAYTDGVTTKFLFAYEAGVCKRLRFDSLGGARVWA